MFPILGEREKEKGEAPDDVLVEKGRILHIPGVTIQSVTDLLRGGGMSRTRGEVPHRHTRGGGTPMSHLVSHHTDGTKGNKCATVAVQTTLTSIPTTYSSSITVLPLPNSNPMSHPMTSSYEHRRSTSYQSLFSSPAIGLLLLFSSPRTSLFLLQSNGPLCKPFSHSSADAGTA